MTEKASPYLLRLLHAASALCAISCLTAAVVLMSQSPLSAEHPPRPGDALALLRVKDYVGAIEQLKELRAAALDPAEAEQLLAEAYLGYAYQLLSGGAFESAREQFRLGGEIAETDVRFLQGEALSWFRQGRYAEAAELLAEATVLAPADATLSLQLGQALYADGRLTEAIDAFEEAVELGGGDRARAQLEKARQEWQVEGEMASSVRGHFDLSFSDQPGNEALAEELLDALEDAYTELGTDLNFYPDVRVPVLLYARRDFTALSRAPDWAGAVYDGKIRLPLGGVGSMSAPLRGLLYHEYMHVLVRFLAGGRGPVWLNEGLAELAGRRYFVPPESDARSALRGGNSLSWQRLERPFVSMSAAEAALAYEQSHAMVRFLVDNYGWYKLSELLEELGSGREWREAIGEVYRDYGLDWPALRREWQASLAR